MYWHALRGYSLHSKVWDLSPVAVEYVFYQLLLSSNCQVSRIFYLERHGSGLFSISFPAQLLPVHLSFILCVSIQESTSFPAPCIDGPFQTHCLFSGKAFQRHMISLRFEDPQRASVNFCCCKSRAFWHFLHPRISSSPVGQSHMIMNPGFYAVLSPTARAPGTVMLPLCPHSRINC